MSIRSRTLDLDYQAPFDLLLTAAVARRQPSNILYPIVDGELRVVLRQGDGHALIGMRQRSAHVVTCRLLQGGVDASWREEVERSLSRLLGLETDLAPLFALLSREPVLGPIAALLSGLRPPRFFSLWETFVQVIPFQQVSLAAAVSVVSRLALEFGPKVPFEGASYTGAPDIDRVIAATPEDLRACGLSAAKAATLRGCADRLRSGALREGDLMGLTNEQAELALRELPGIGPWSAQLVLLRGMGRLGIFPQGDSGASKGLRGAFADTASPEAEARAALERLAGWQGYVYFMLLGRRLQASQRAMSSYSRQL